jgi:hypothetical protein
MADKTRHDILKFAEEQREVLGEYSKVYIIPPHLR